MKCVYKRVRHRGFTLVEMALVLFIIALLIKSAVMPLAALQDHAARKKAQAQVLQIRESLLAHVVAYGALPCPLPVNNSSQLSLGSLGSQIEDANASSCKVSSGFVPAGALRLAGSMSDSGALLDPWSREYHYSVSLQANSSEAGLSEGFWTEPGKAASVGVSELGADLVLCHSFHPTNCSGQSVRGDQIAFVVLSTGLDNSSQGSQKENLDNDAFFMVTEESVVEGSEFDDIVAWGSAAEVMYWMLRMGWLP